LRLKTQPRLRFAGQITGCEGYVESAAMGLMAGRLAAAERRGEVLTPPPPTTAMGALLAHVTGGHLENGKIDQGPSTFQPMNVNFGLFPPIDAETRDAAGKKLKGEERARARKRALARRALADLGVWLGESAVAAAE
jgi:methylenetetrahydrofolate--tRNA-(uracil-5-)-methyltransferase